MAHPWVPGKSTLKYYYTSRCSVRNIGTVNIYKIAFNFKVEVVDNTALSTTSSRKNPKLELLHTQTGCSSRTIIRGEEVENLYLEYNRPPDVWIRRTIKSNLFSVRYERLAKRFILVLMKRTIIGSKFFWVFWKNTSPFLLTSVLFLKYLNELWILFYL